MTERTAPTQPPLISSDGRLILYADGEYQAFSRDNRSWTTGVLDRRDVSALIAYLPTVADNVMHMWDER